MPLAFFRLILFDFAWKICKGYAIIICLLLKFFYFETMSLLNELQAL
jgi:hypothetical protein